MTPMMREAARLYAKGASEIKACIGAGYSEKYATQNGHKLFKRDDVRAEVNRLRARLNERAEKSSTDVVNEYAKIAFTDRVDFLKPDPFYPDRMMYKAPTELTDEQRSLVEDVRMKVTKHTTEEGEEVFRQEYTYVLSDKANALQQMGRHFGIFDDKLRLTSQQQNPFANATPEQLAQLKQSFVGIMTGDTVDGEYEEVTNMLPHDQGRTGSGE